MAPGRMRFGKRGLVTEQVNSLEPGRAGRGSHRYDLERPRLGYGGVLAFFCLTGNLGKLIRQVILAHPIHRIAGIR